MSRRRSWVSGRAGLTPCCPYAMAVASTAPIQIGRYRSPSTSRSRTIGWLLGSSTRTPTTLSSRTARLRVVVVAAPHGRPYPARYTHGVRIPPVRHTQPRLGEPPLSGRVRRAVRRAPERRGGGAKAPAAHGPSRRHGPARPGRSGAPEAPEAG